MPKFEIRTEHQGSGYSSGSAFKKIKVVADTVGVNGEWTTFYRTLGDDKEEFILKVRTSKILSIKRLD